MRDRTGGPIDRQTEVGGHPGPESTVRALDVPESGPAERLRAFTVAVESV